MMMMKLCIVELRLLMMIMMILIMMIMMMMMTMMMMTMSQYNIIRSGRGSTQLLLRSTLWVLQSTAQRTSEGGRRAVISRARAMAGNAGGASNAGGAAEHVLLAPEDIPNLSRLGQRICPILHN